MKYRPNCHYSHNHRLGNRNMFYEWPVVEIYLKMLPVYHIFHISQDIHQNVQMRLLPFPKKDKKKNVLKIELYTQKYTQSKEGLSSILLIWLSRFFVRKGFPIELLVFPGALKNWFFPRKKYFLKLFQPFFTFILCNFSVQTLQYFQRNFKLLFHPWKL